MLSVHVSNFQLELQCEALIDFGLTCVGSFGGNVGLVFGLDSPLLLLYLEENDTDYSSNSAATKTEVSVGEVDDYRRTQALLIERGWGIEELVVRDLRAFLG